MLFKKKSTDAEGEGNSQKKKQKKPKKPKVSPTEKAVKNKKKVERQAKAKVQKADAKIKKAEQSVKKAEKKAENKIKKKELKEAKLIKAEENKIHKKEQKREKKKQNKVRKKEIKAEKKAAKMQRKAELAARTPIQKRIDRRLKLRKFLLVVLLLMVLAGLVFLGIKLAPKVLAKIDLPEIHIAETIGNVKDTLVEKLPFFKDEEEEPPVEEEEETPPADEEPVVEDDPTLYIAGSSSFEPFFTEALAAFLGLSDEELPEHVSVLSTTDAYTNLVNGDAQVIFSATPTSKETRMAEMAGVDLQTIPIMNSGFVFFVSEDNPVKSLTVTQLYNIYCGTITNWKEVGGKNEPIVALQRTENSGSQTGMYKHVISKKEISKVDSSMKIESTKDIVSQVAKDSGAIGYSYYYYVDKLKSTDGIKMIPVNGVKPSKDTIATAEYPLTTYTCATIITDEGSQTLEDVISSVEAELNAAETTEGAVEDTSDLPLKLQFVQWILGEEGQKLVEKHGFIRHDN